MAEGLFETGGSGTMSNDLNVKGMENLYDRIREEVFKEPLESYEILSVLSTSLVSSAIQGKKPEISWAKMEATILQTVKMQFETLRSEYERGRPSA